MAAQDQPPKLISFGPYRLDLANSELWKSGIRLRMPQQAARVLEKLVSQPGEVVTREELRRAIWSDDTFVDFEHGLNNCVKELRGMLCDDATNPRYIETIPRRGYRFVMPVEAISEGAPKEHVLCGLLRTR